MPFFVTAVVNSWSIHPCPNPAMTPPPLSWSRVARRRAMTTGTWNGMSTTLVPSLIVLVWAAAKARDPLGSYAHS